MPRRQRYTETGYHHIISRGVERRNVFVDDACFDKFLSLIGELSSEFNVVIHAFCLMSNHYHILLETKEDNLSFAIKKLNSHYASWFNRTFERSGHLWQGRYKSYYIYNDTYFWTVAKYIERNPIAAGIVQNIDVYLYQSYYIRLHPHHPRSSLVSNSKTNEMPINEYMAFISTPLSGELQKSVYSVARKNRDTDGRVFLEKHISSFFEKDGNRNDKIRECYEYGYTKAAIAEYLNLSKMAITKILR